MARDDDGRYAVENTNRATGETVRLLETEQEWVAKAFAERANAAFAEAQVDAVSSVVRIS